jgi:hypothetical protein
VGSSDYRRRSPSRREFARPHELENELVTIYCVIPEPLADELFDKLTDYYRDDPGVEVIVERRKSERRTAGSTGGGQRQLRDRRRRRPGTFPEVEVPTG